MKNLTLVLSVLCLFVVTGAAFPAPSERYSIDKDGQSVFFRGTKVCNTVDLPEVDRTVFRWMQVNTPQPSVWIFNPYMPDKTPFFLPVADGEECVNVFMPDEEEVFIVELKSSQNKLSILVVCDMKGKKLFSTQGKGPLYWIDGHRCLFTSFVKGKRIATGASVLQILNDTENDIDVTPVAEPDELTDYTAEGVENDDCILIMTKVKSPREWNNPDRNTTQTKITVPVPAAG